MDAANFSLQDVYQDCSKSLNHFAVTKDIASDPAKIVQILIPGVKGCRHREPSGLLRGLPDGGVVVSAGRRLVLEGETLCPMKGEQGIDHFGVELSAALSLDLS